MTADYTDDDFDGEGGYYRVWYERTRAPMGPYESVKDLAFDQGLADYPGDGYIVHVDAHGPTDNFVIGSVPSLNPDDLAPQAVADCMAAGTHLTSCDDDGYCNNCGHQEGGQHG